MGLLKNIFVYFNSDIIYIMYLFYFIFPNGSYHFIFKN